MTFTKPLSDKDVNYKTMMESVNSLFDKHPDIIVTYPRLAAKKVILSSYITQLDTTFEERDELRKGKAAEKNTAREELIHIAAICAAAGRSLAREKNDDALFEILNYNENKLDHLRDLSVYTACSEIYTAIDANKVDLIGNGLTEEKITSFLTKKEKYNQVFGDTKSDLSSSSAATVKKENIFASTRLLFEDIDDMVETLKDDFEDFFNEYKAARVIHDLGVSHLAAPVEPAPQNP